MSYQAVVPPEMRGWLETIFSWFGAGSAVAESSVRSLEAQIHQLRAQNAELHTRITALDSELNALQASRKNPTVKKSMVDDLRIEIRAVRETIRSNLGHIARARDAIRNQNDKTHLRAINQNIEQLLASAPNVSIAKTRSIHSKVRAENSQLKEVVQRTEDYEDYVDSEEDQDFDSLGDTRYFESENNQEATLTPSQRSQLLTE